MKKKNMKPIVLSALLALSFGAVSVGTTFALFTDVAEANVAVKAGEVKVTNEIQILEAKSLNDHAETVTSGTDVTYINGGTANVDNTTGKVTISRWTPGDSVTLQTTPVNGSNVKTKMRLRVVMSGDLAPALKVTGIKNNTNAFVISGKKTYCTAWTLTEAGVNPDAYDVKIEFPDSDNGKILFGSENKDNKYQGKEAEIHIYYEAVQGNAAIDDLLERVNSRLAEEEIIDGKANDTMHEAFADLEDLLTPADAKSNHFVWNYETDAFARESAVTADQYKYFKVADEYVTDFSMYASEAWTHTDVALTGLGFDAGAHTDIASITYTGAAEARENIIRTNGGSLTVNAAQDTIRHYGNADTVNIVAVASNSYHVYGVVPFIQISKGRVAIEETGKVTGIHVANVQTVEQNGEITKTANTFSHDVVLTLNGENVKLTRDTAGTDINDPILVCEVQEDENSDEYIWLFGDGTIENAKVYVTDSKDAPDTSVKSTTTQDNASAAAKAIANNAVNTGTEADPVYEAQESGKSAEAAEFVATAFASGNGTQNDPFLIETTEHWMNISHIYDKIGQTTYYKVISDLNFANQDPCVNRYEYAGATYEDRYYCLTDDATQDMHIDLNDHTLSNVDYPLFDVIYHLDIHNGKIGYTGEYGGIVDSVSSRAETSLNVHDLVLFGTIDTSYSHFGPVVSYCYLKNDYNCTVTLENINNQLKITNARTSSYTGGFIGYIQGSKASLIVKDCTFSGSIQGMYVGGFVGGCSAPNGSPVVSTGNKVNGSLLGSTSAKAFGLSGNVTGGKETVNAIENSVTVSNTATIKTISPDTNLVSTSIEYGEEFVINHSNSNVAYYTATLSFNIDMADGSSGGYPRNIMFTINTTQANEYNTGLFKCYIESSETNNSTSENLVLNQSGVVVWKVGDTYYVYSDAYKLSTNGKAYLYIYGYDADGGLVTYINASYVSKK